MMEGGKLELYLGRDLEKSGENEAQSRLVSGRLESVYNSGHNIRRV